MKELTARQRVKMALDHKEPDRIPICFGCTPTSTMVESIPNGRNYTKLCQYLGVDNYPEPKISEVYNNVLNVDERIMRKFGSDFRLITPNIPPATINPDGTKTWKPICGMRIKRMGYYDEPFDFPGKNWTSKRDLGKYPFWPDPTEFDVAKGKREEARNLYENTEYAIVADSYFSLFPFNLYPQICGFEKWLMDMKLNPEFFFALSDKLLELGLAFNKEFFKAVGDYIDVAVVYDDMGTQENLFMSVKDYRKFIKPYTKQIIEEIKKYTKAKILMHSCGSIYEIIPDLIEIGVDILNPVQPRAKRMEPWRLKKEFGRDISFWGGIDIQELLPHGTVEEVKKGVREVIEVYAPGGGYVLGPSHNIEPDTPPKNIVAMYEAALEYGKYPMS